MHPRISVNQTQTNLNIATQREIFPERVALEPIVSKNPTEIGMLGEEDSIHVPDL